MLSLLRRNLLLVLTACLLAPVALAQDAGQDEAPEQPEEVDVNIDIDDNDGPDEAIAGDRTDSGFGATTLVILIVLGIVVIGLIVALASRRP